jgi:DNA-binding MarR family transcriptional regulator
MIDSARVTHDEEYRMWGLLRQVSDGMLRARDEELKPFGISAVQFGVLYVLKMLEKADMPPTPSEISRWLFREPHTVSALLDRMEKQGLVRSLRNSPGRGKIRVVLTEKGEEVYRAQNKGRRVIPTILESLSAEERKQLGAFLERLRKKTLEALVVEPPLP